MINIGMKNRWALEQCLREEFERELIQLHERLAHVGHNFSKAIPQFTLNIKVDAEFVHRVILEKELADAKKRIARLEKAQGGKNEPEQD